MSKQEIVCVLHSEHSQTAGQESSASDPAVTGRLTSVNNAHVITCMLDLRALRSAAAKYPQLTTVSPPDSPFSVHSNKRVITLKKAD